MTASAATVHDYSRAEFYPLDLRSRREGCLDRW